jgi:hypothetical protein
MNRAWHFYDRACLFLILFMVSHDTYARWLWLTVFACYFVGAIWIEHKDSKDEPEVVEEVLGTGLGKQNDYGCWEMGDEEVDLWPIKDNVGVLVFRRKK